MPNDLDLLQGSWAVTALEVDGKATPEAMVSEARIEIEGDRFTSTGMGHVYTGTLLLDAAATPRRLDMKFDAGPEAGNTNRGIYELKADAWKLCLATRGDERPTRFATKPGSGHALETLKRETSKAGKKKTKATASDPPAGLPALLASTTEFEGEWRMVSGVMNGVPTEESLLHWVKRVNEGDISTVLAGPQTMLKVRFTTDASQSPHAIDYVNLAGANKGKSQQGIYALEGGVLKICVAAPGAARPAEFRSVKGDGRVFTEWKRA